MDSLEPNPFRLLIDRVFPRAKPHFWAAFPATAAPLALCGVTLAFLQHRMMSSIEGDDPAAMFGYFGGFLLASLVMLIAYVLVYSALGIAAMESVHRGTPFSLGRGWRKILQPKFLSTIALWTVVGFASLLTCVVPALIVVPLLALTLNVMVAEDLYGLDALRRSATLVAWSPGGRPLESNFLRVAALIFVGWGVQAGVGMLAQGPLTVLQQFHVLRDAAGGVETTSPAAAVGPLWILVAAQFFSALASAVAWLYWAFGFALLYGELRRRREGGDLRAAILELTEPAADLAAAPG